MASQEHVDLLKQGVEPWNEWREQNQEIRPDLSRAILRNVDLSGTNLSGANLISADLGGANLSDANLSDACLIYTILYRFSLHDEDLSDYSLIGVSLRNANLHNADLSGVDLLCADLSGADLRDANLRDANLSNTKLNGTKLHNAYLRNANLRGASLSDADLQGAIVGNTLFAQIDLREVKGLTGLHHQGPSSVELRTVRLPSDGSAIHFLRGTGVPEEWIDFWRTTMMQPIQYHSLFISYSSKDETQARCLYADLQASGVRCWFAPEDLKIGDRFHARINEAIHIQDKLLLLFSKHSIQSDWVEIEVRAALEKEHRQNRNVLFPVCLDSSVRETSQAWAAMLRQSRHIGDFTNWTDPQAYQQAFERLLRDLKKADEQQNQERKQ
jgi:uncharacterized protein YjbI with pentapeptide repeats